MRKCSLQFIILRNLETTGRSGSFMFLQKDFTQKGWWQVLSQSFTCQRVARCHSPKECSKAPSYEYNICNGTRGHSVSESLFCVCPCTDNVVVSHELYSSNSFTPFWDCAWGKNSTMRTFIAHHPQKLRHLLDYSTANTTKSNTVSQHPPVFCIYDSCVSSDMD
jgi:hypothetical protein